MKSNGDEVNVFGDTPALTRAAAEHFALVAAKAVEDHGVFSVALSGGSTPKALYQLIASDQAIRTKIAWAKVHVFFGDERHVSPDHSDSNFRMANEAMFSALRGEKLQVHRIKGELPDANAAALKYEADLKAFFEPHGLLNEGFPRFDLIFLGMGPDGHTASLFPGSSGLNEKTRWVISNWVQKFQTDRITMTYPVLNSAAEVILLVSGAEKASVLARALGPETGGLVYPVQGVRPRNGVKRWMLDAPAAADLATNPS
jgi:6-phosphogluconolactonase